MIDMELMGKRAKAAARKLAIIPTEKKNDALHVIADTLIACQDEILAANEQDVSDGREDGLTEAVLDRLKLTPKRIQSIAGDTHDVANLTDPVGEIFDERTLPNGLKISRRRVPLGVIGVIYEARPNVTIDIAALCLKSGNAAILRGGRETLRSNMEMVKVIQKAMDAVGLPGDAFQYIDDPDRKYVAELLRLDRYVDMIIPRGGAGLHRFALENSTIPVITGGLGICHLFIDATADQENALEIIHNAKTQRPSVCNALDTALVHKDIASEFIPRMVERLEHDGVLFRADNRSMTILQGKEHVQAAGPDDFDQEWLSLVLGIKVVDTMDEAIDHIEEHSTRHSDGILTNDMANAEAFVQGVDSSAVFVNTSTRFNDGGQFGLGAEVAVSTQKLHARGPVALDGLTTYKWVVVGEGQIRE